MEHCELIENFNSRSLLHFSTKQTWSTHFPITFKYFLISFCYVNCQNILVNVLVHLLEHLSFWHKCLSFLFSKLCFIIKVSTICGAGRDTRNLCHKCNSQGPALRILCFRVTCPKFQQLSCKALGVRVPCPRFPVPEYWVSGYCAQGIRIAGPWVPVLGLRVPGLRSWF